MFGTERGKRWRSVCAARLLALLLWPALLGPALPPRVAARDSCLALTNAYARNDDGSARPEREASVHGRARTLRVAGDRRAPARAAAALLAAGLRHRLRYRRVQLHLHDAYSSLCSFAKLMQTNCQNIDVSDDFYNYLVLSPAVAWSGRRCLSLVWCRGSTEVAPRLAAAGRGAAPARLLLHVHLTARASARRCENAVFWEFYADHSNFLECEFVRGNKSLRATVYTSNGTLEWKKINEIYRDIVATKLQLNVIILGEDADLRRELFQLLKKRNSSFLFIDYDLWNNMTGVYKVQPPPFNTSITHDSTRTIRVADDRVLRQFAPQVMQGLQVFSPTAIDLREILEIEATTPQVGIEEAACSWASKNKAKFDSWFQIDYKSQHTIAIFLCENDPDQEEYKRAAWAIQNIHSTDSQLNIGLNFVKIDCGSASHLSNEFMKISMSAGWQRLIGAVVAGAGEGARAAAALAPGAETALLLGALPAARVRLGAVARASSGTLHQLAIAIQHFLDMYQWNRLAVLSDDTEVAKDLVESLSDKRRLKVHNVFLSGNISDILESLRNLNSRIFFINTGPDAVQDIFCAANRLSMTDPLKYVWILRERRAVDLNCGKDFPQKHTHFTISYWWRGGNNTQSLSVTANEQNKTKNILRSTLDHLWHGNTWPPLAAPLVDSLEVLIKSFKTFTQSHPDKYYDLHGDGSAGLLLNSLEHQQTDGVMQNLHFVNGTLSEPLVFVDKWVGNRREPIFIWRIQDGHVEPITNATYGVQYPSDGTEFCLTNPHNDSFVPSCHDSIYLSALGFLIVATLALCLSRRLRLKRLAKKDSLLRAQLLAQRECMSSELADHYVDRAALELYDYLGQGCYGRVRYAIFRAPERQPISVAVKELRDDVPLTEESELLREACTLATLCHDHIVRLIGVCATDGPLLVLLEYAFFGNLCEYLCERRHLAERAMITDVDENDEAYHVSAPSLNRMAREIASALAYLALKRIVHRDVRASNCLVDARRSLKLADFGLARKTGTGVTGEEEYSCRRRGMFPVLWMAPESFDRGVFSAASDAWALGVLLLELVSLGARPYGAWPPGRVLQYVSAGGRPPLPPDVSETTRQLLVKLWRRAPELRLSAAALLARLEADAAALQPALAPAPPPADELCPALGDDDEATVLLSIQYSNSAIFLK